MGKDLLLGKEEAECEATLTHTVCQCIVTRS